MRLLYISSYHDTLEFSELKLFHEMGIEVMSTGNYLFPNAPRFGTQRPAINIPECPMAAKFHAVNRNQKCWSAPILPKEIVDYFDIVYVAHCSPNHHYLRLVWSAIRHKKVLYRTYGLELQHQEDVLAQCKREGQVYSVRFSAKEEAIPGYAGTDFAILPYVDEDEYKDWNGSTLTPLSFQNWFRTRYKLDNYSVVEPVLRKYNTRVHGLMSPLGPVSFEQQKELYRNARVYWGYGSRPSPIVLNIFEAMLTGCPVVTWGHQYGNGTPPMYQMPEIIENWKNGLCTDDMNEVDKFISKCLNDEDFARMISTNARIKALNTFSKAYIKPQWENLFEKIKTVKPCPAPKLPPPQQYGPNWQIINGRKRFR